MGEIKYHHPANIMHVRFTQKYQDQTNAPKCPNKLIYQSHKANITISRFNYHQKGTEMALQPTQVKNQTIFHNINKYYRICRHLSTDHYQIPVIAGFKFAAAAAASPSNTFPSPEKHTDPFFRILIRGGNNHSVCIRF